MAVPLANIVNGQSMLIKWKYAVQLHLNHIVAQGNCSGGMILRVNQLHEVVDQILITKIANETDMLQDFQSQGFWRQKI